jgi:hypothetical protein
MNVGNGEGEYSRPEYAYPSTRLYQRRPRGNICPVCGSHVQLQPKNHMYWLKFHDSEIIPLCLKCGRS